jgi:heptosyltransferase-2
LKKILIIQTAFIGDVILATAAAEKLHNSFPDAQIDFLLRKGNESMLDKHPFINSVIVWNKKNGKVKNLFRLTKLVRKTKYDYVINLHRFASSGIITALSGAKTKIGFDKNPLSFLFSKTVKHQIGNGLHETERNQLLIESITDKQIAKPKLYPKASNYDAVKKYTEQEYVCMAPTSVWFTKQLPHQKWVELCNQYDTGFKIYLLGAPGDYNACNKIATETKNKNVQNLAGKLSFLDSAALMQNAVMNYVNDSAPMHIASAVNAPTTAIFCSTVPAFGFGPLSSNSKIVELTEKLNCRPCGLHGYKKCPETHFKCGFNIDVKNII